MCFLALEVLGVKQGASSNLKESWTILTGDCRQLGESRALSVNKHYNLISSLFLDSVLNSAVPCLLQMNVGGLVFCHHTVVLFVLANTESVEMQKSAESLAPLCLLLLTFERRLWIVRFPSCWEQDSTEWEAPSYNSVFSPLEIDCSVYGSSWKPHYYFAGEICFQQSRLLETAKLVWHLNLSQGTNMALLPKIRGVVHIRGQVQQITYLWAEQWVG